MTCKLQKGVLQSWDASQTTSLMRAHLIPLYAFLTTSPLLKAQQKVCLWRMIYYASQHAFYQYVFEFNLTAHPTNNKPVVQPWDCSKCLISVLKVVYNLPNSQSLPMFLIPFQKYKESFLYGFSDISLKGLTHSQYSDHLQQRDDVMRGTSHESYKSRFQYHNNLANFEGSKLFLAISRWRQGAICLQVPILFRSTIVRLFFSIY